MAFSWSILGSAEHAGEIAVQTRMKKLVSGGF